MCDCMYFTYVTAALASDSLSCTVAVKWFEVTKMSQKRETVSHVPPWQVWTPDVAGSLGLWFAGHLSSLQTNKTGRFLLEPSVSLAPDLLQRLLVSQQQNRAKSSKLLHMGNILVQRFCHVDIAG